MARGTDLDVAAGAAVALRPLVHDDDHQVSQVAQAALDAISPRPETSRVDLGPVLCGQPAHARVWVEGSPLALASAVQTSGPGVEARLDAGWLHVQVVPRRTGPVDAAVTLVGAAGDARVDIVGEATAPAPTEEPKAAAVVPLVLLGAAAVAAAWWLKEGDPWRAATLPLVVPAIACLAAAVCLARHRLHAVAVGTVAGVAAWSVIFWARNTVYDMTSDKIAILPGDPAAFAAHWARLVAAVVLGIAVVSTIKATPRLRARVSLQPGSWSAVGVLLTVAGVLQPIIALAYQGPGDPEMVATQWMLILVVCLPVAWLGFNADQRRAALAGVVALTMFIVLRSVWEMIADQGLQPHLTVGAAAAMVMAGSVVGQARLRPAPHGRAPHPPGIAASG